MAAACNGHRRAMDLSPATFEAADTEPVFGGTARATPLAFDGIAGFYHAAGGDTAVLLLAPWGYKELCSRKTFRILGEALAAAGYPCLRFDYPGTGHSAESSADIADDHAWRAATRRALAELRALSGAQRVVAMGQGIGGAFAATLAQETVLDGLVLMAPVASGRTHLRELAAWTAMTRETFMVDASDGPEGGLMAGGFILSAATAAEWRALDLVKGAAPEAKRILQVERPNHPGDEKLLGRLAAEGRATDRIAFEGYGDYTANPTLATVPAQTVGRIVDWVASNFPVGHELHPPYPARDLPATIEGDFYRQTLIRFGPDRLFFGALTEPAGERAKAVVLFLNSGHDHSAGWGRMTVDFARALAQGGIASLRVDLAGIGETPPWPDQSGQVLYSKRQVEDVKAAVDWLAGTLGAERIVVAGRCSGAYLAFVAAVAETRVSGAFLINSRRFVWDPAEDVDAVIREPIQTLATYRAKMADGKTLARILSGDLPVSRAASRLTRAVLSVADRKLAPLLRGLSKHHRLSRVVRERFSALQARDVPVMLVYSEGDRGLEEVEARFGADHAGLARHPNARLMFVEGADHNLTPPAPRAKVLEALRDFAVQVSG